MPIVPIRIAVKVYTTAPWEFTIMPLDGRGLPRELMGGTFSIPVKRSPAEPTALFTYTNAGADFVVTPVANYELIDPVLGTKRGDALALTNPTWFASGLTALLPLAFYYADIYRTDLGHERLLGLEIEQYQGA